MTDSLESAAHALRQKDAGYYDAINLSLDDRFSAPSTEVRQWKEIVETPMHLSPPPERPINPLKYFPKAHAPVKRKPRLAPGRKSVAILGPCEDGKPHTWGGNGQNPNGSRRATCGKCRVSTSHPDVIALLKKPQRRQAK